MTDQIPWWEPKLGAPVEDAVMRCLQSTFINDGPTTRLLEARMAAIAGVRHGVATPSCTTALALVLLGLGIGHGDEVIVPDLTFIATANAVKLVGADVRLVDVDAKRLTIDPVKVAAAITPRTRAVIAVDYNGRGADYQALDTICTAHGLALISDAAQALGSRHHDRALGSNGVAGCFSFSGHKMFFAGQGGMVVTDDDALVARLRDLRDHAKRDQSPLGDMHHVSLGYNFKLTSLQAAALLPQLDEMDERLDHARRRDDWFREMMADLPGLRFIPREPGEAILWGDVFTDRRDDLNAAMNGAGIGCRRFYLPLHRQPPYAGEDCDFPNATEVWRTGLWLPSALSLTRADAERVAAIAQGILR
jgi:perosamine synthetase